QSLLVANPINRYLINSPMLPELKKDADGGINAPHPERIPRQGKGSQLAARAERAFHYVYASLLAERRSDRRQMDCTQGGDGEEITQPTNQPARIHDYENYTTTKPPNRHAR